jgi:hypothetical protein
METRTRFIDVSQFRDYQDTDTTEFFCRITAEGSDSREPRVFVFLLKDEFQFLNSDTHWLHHLEKAQTYVVRCEESDFKALEIGRHPKTLVFYNKVSELASYNGIPAQAELNACLRRIIYEDQRVKTSG